MGWLNFRKEEKMEKIKVTFIFNLNDSFSTDMTSGFVTFLNSKDIDDLYQDIEVLVDADKLHEIKVDTQRSDGFWHTYHVETVTPYKDGNETKYSVVTWAMEE